MKASNISVSQLASYEACYYAIEAIEADWLNILGGLRAWNSGYTTYLTKAAEKKIAAIKARMEKKWPDEDE